MRIALYHNLPSGGGKRAVYEWTRRLSREHELDAYTLNGADHAFCDIRHLVGQYRIFPFAPHALFKRRGWGRLNPLQRWRDLGNLERLGRHVADRIDAAAYDIVFAQPCLYTLIPVPVAFLRTPAVYYLHEPFGPTFKRTIQRPYLKAGAQANAAGRMDPLVHLYESRLKRLQAQSVAGVTAFLANSSFTQQQMRLAYDIQAQLCRLGVNTDDFRPLTGVGKQDSVISVGELSPRKGFDFLIESLALIPAGRRPALKVASNWELPAERRYLEVLASRYKVDLRIVTGLSTQQLALEYNKAQLCVYAPVLEPFGLVPLESMACGTPVVGVSEGGVCETVLHEETGYLTERDPRKFAEAIESLLGDPVLRKRFGEQGRSYVENEWEWDRSVRDLEIHLIRAARPSVERAV